MRLYEIASISDKIWYHGSDREFTKFDDKELGSRLGKSGIGFWFTDNPELVGFYGHIHYAVKLNVKKTKIITANVWANVWETGVKSFTHQAKLAKQEGYDSIVFENVIDGDKEATNICVFDSRKIKIISTTNTYPDDL